jgi:hypothetical protein
MPVIPALGRLHNEILSQNKQTKQKKKKALCAHIRIHGMSEKSPLNTCMCPVHMENYSQTERERERERERGERENMERICHNTQSENPGHTCTHTM